MRLNHHRRGRGEPLLLIHGIGHHWQAWWPVLALLAHERDVVAVDLPGFGESLTLRDEKPSVPVLARVVAGFARDELGWETAHVGGSSLGGGIGLELARTGFARSLVAFSPIGFYSPRELAYTRAVLRTARAAARGGAAKLVGVPVLRRALLATLLAHGDRYPLDHVRAGLDNLAHSPGWGATVRHAIRWRWPGGDTGVPTTIAWGTLDGTLPVSQARTAERALPGARHVRLHGLGHLPMWEDPERVAELLLSPG